MECGPNLKKEDSEEEDWNGNRQKAKEEEKGNKEDQLKIITIPQVHSTYHPTTDRQSHHYKT